MHVIEAVSSYNKYSSLEVKVIKLASLADFSSKLFRTFTGISVMAICTGPSIITRCTGTLVDLLKRKLRPTIKHPGLLFRTYGFGRI